MPSSIILVQARMNSTRLPGKVLRPAAGKPMLGYLLERLARLPSGTPVAVATSDTVGDDPIADFCGETGVACLRGPLDDVAARFLLALDKTGADTFVRISGDSPLLDTSLVERALALSAETGADLVTNVKTRTYPKGMSVELVTADALRRAHAAMTRPGDTEHVTPVFYRTPENWHIETFTSGRELGDINLSVDTPDDFAALESLLKQMEGPHWSYGLDDILALRDVAEPAHA